MENEATEFVEEMLDKYLESRKSHFLSERESLLIRLGEIDKQLEEDKEIEL